MPASYRLDLFSPTGVLESSIGWHGSGGAPEKSGFEWLTCRLQVNGPGQLIAQLPAEHLAVAKLVDRSQVELWEEYPEYGIDLHQLFSGIWRSPQYQGHGSKGIFTLVADGDLSLLDWRIVNYHANYTGRTRFINQPAETIMKELVKYNITGDATTANGRKRNGTNWPSTQISIEADSARGISKDWFCHGQKLLESLQKLAAVGGGDFDLVKTGPDDWEFRYYPGQLGTDRTASLVFSTARNNMENLAYSLGRSEERTVACVWGPGDDEVREYLTRTGANFSASNDREIYVDAADAITPSGRETRGDQKLDELQAREEFPFSIQETEACVFNRHVFIGDLATAVNHYTGADLTVKVHAAMLTLNRAGRRVDIEVRTP